MMTRLLILVALFCALKSTAQHPTDVTIPDSNTLKEWLKEQNVQTIAIATIEDGRLNPLLIEENTAGDSSMKSTTVFDVASLTKTITTLLTLELVSNGSWVLDEPLYNYWIDPDVKNDTLHQQLTTRHVLSHKTGFANWRRMHETKKLTFEFEPGAKFQYSGEGFEYLRRALENKFNTSFEQLTDSLVFKPNNMHHSSLVWNDSIDDLGFAGTYDEAGKLYEYDKSFKANAADNLLTTIEDFGKLGVNIINREYLDQKLYDEMISQQSIVREGINFGLGWIVFNDLPNDEYAIFNAGSDQGVNALIVLLPKSKQGLIVFTNSDNGRALAMKTIGEVLGDAGKEILSRF